jgi:hypothetical protein
MLIYLNGDYRGETSFNNSNFKLITYVELKKERAIIYGYIGGSQR